MGRSPCCVKEGLNRGAWTSQEDKLLKEYIEVHGEGKWRSLPKRAGLKRCGKSCRLRWLNYLRPDIKRGNITDDEEDLIIRLHKLLGNRWSLIAGRLPGRTDNEIKNYWNTNISKRLHGDDHQPGCGGRGRRRRHFNSTHRNPPTTTRSESEAKENLSSSSNNIIKPQQVHGPPLIIPQIREESSYSYVVRTKASRCTKVFIDAQVEQTQQQLGSTINNNLAIMKAPSMNTTTTDHEGTLFKDTTASSSREEPSPTQQLVPTTVAASQTFLKEDIINNISPADHFEMDVDNEFLSEFLFTTTPFDFDLEFADINLLLPTPAAADDNNYNNNNNNPSSENATSSSLSAQEVQQNYSDLAPMASLPDPALDWLQDA